MQEAEFDEPVCEDDFLNEHVNSILFHSMIVSHLAYKVGKELGFSDEICYELANAGILHDIGKIHLDNQLRQLEKSKKNGMGSEADANRYVRNHSIYGYYALKDRGFSEYILDSVLYHHENYDGTGYPDGLNGNDIPQGARILRVCDVFAALVDRRVYRAALDLDVAVETMIDEVKNYDMKVFLAFQRVIHEDDMVEFSNWIVEHNRENAEKADAKKREQKARKKKYYRLKRKRKSVGGNKNGSN